MQAESHLSGRKNRRMQVIGAAACYATLMRVGGNLPQLVSSPSQVSDLEKYFVLRSHLM